MTFDGTALVPSAKARILGIIIDAHLTREAHVSLVVRRCYTLHCVVSKLSRSLTYDVKKFLIELLVIPHIMYCITAWSGCGATQKKRVQKVLNHCARVVFSVRKFEHVCPLLEELQWASVDRRVCERDIAMVTVKQPVCTSVSAKLYKLPSWRVRQRYSGSCHWTAAAVACPHRIVSINTLPDAIPFIQGEDEA